MSEIYTTNADEAIGIELDSPPGPLEIRFYVAEAPIQSDLDLIRETLAGQGVDVRQVLYNNVGKYVSVIYVKPESVAGIAAFPLAIIPMISTLGILALIAFGIVNVENIAKLLLILFGGTIILAALLRKPIEVAATGYAKRF